MAFKRVDHVGIVVADFEAANRFMTEILGLKQLREPEPGVRSSRAFYRIGDMDIQIVKDDERLGSAKTGRLEHISFDVDSLEEATSALRAAGVEMLTEPEVIREGRGRTAHTTESGPLGVRFQLTDELGSG